MYHLNIVTVFTVCYCLSCACYNQHMEFYIGLYVILFFIFLETDYVDISFSLNQTHPHIYVPWQGYLARILVTIICLRLSLNT